jgi:integrase
MPTVIKRGDHQFQCKVRKTGYPPQSETFETYNEAWTWGIDVEAQMNRGDFRDRKVAMSYTLKQMVERYEIEVTPHKKGAKQEKYYLRILKECHLAKRPFGSITPEDVMDLRDKRLEVVGPATTARTMNLLSAIYRQAREWRIPVENPCSGVRRPAAPDGRSRRPSEEELTWICAATESVHLAGIICVAIETTMRRSEMTNSEREHYQRDIQTLSLFETKNGDGRAVPLSTRAMAILDALPVRDDGKLFGIKPDSVTQAFGRARKRARARYEKAVTARGEEPDPKFLVDLRLHDMRHEGTSRLFEDKGFDATAASAVTGHRDLRSLKRYTHLNAHKLAQRLG